MAAITVQQIALAGLTPSAAAAASGGGDTFVNNGLTFLEVTNGGGSSINVTVAGAQACSQGSTHDNVVAVGAGATKLIGPFPASRFNNPATGAASVTYSSATSVTVRAFSL